MAAKPETKTKSAPAAASEAAGVKPGMELTEAQRTALAEMQQQLQEDAGAGFEDASSDAYAIPFLYILQSGSPQCKRSEVAHYIPGAEEGMFFNTVTGEIYDGQQGGVLLVPVHYTQRFVEWKPRESGGGFVQEHPPTSPLIGQTTKDEKNRDKLPNGNNLVDTRNHYCLLVVNDSVSPVVVSMSSTQVKKSRNWMSKMNNMRIPVGNKMSPAPMFSQLWRVTTVPESNDQGSWFGWKVEHYGPVTDIKLYNAAKEFRDAVIKGRAQAQQPTDIPGEAETIEA